MVGGIAFIVIDGREYDGSQGQARAAQASIRAGMTIGEAEQIVLDAWGHKQCDYETLSHHIFFVGSHNPERVGLVLVETRVLDGQEKVTGVYAPEPYEVSLYQHCPDVGPKTP